MLDEQSRRTSCCSKSILNVVLLGIGFMLSMGAYTTTAMSQTVILNSVQDEYFNGTSTVGYNVLCAVYASTAVSFLLAPAISAVVGPKFAMVGGSAFLLVYVVMFLRPLTVTLYTGAVLQGLGQGLIWTTYGHFLVNNSEKKTIGRNTGIFWCLFMSNMVFGNLFYFLMVRGATIVSEFTRTIIFSVLITAAAMGTATLTMLKHPWIHKPHLKLTNGIRGKKEGPLDALRGLAKITLSKNMLLLMPTFVYMGLDLSFFINVYGTSLGYSRLFGDIRESLVGLNGVFIGLGQITGGILFGLSGRLSHKHGRDPAIIFGVIVHLISFYIMYLNLPSEAPLRETYEPSIIGPNPYVAMACSYLLGLGDSAWNNQLFQLLGTLYPNQSVAAFALFQFVQCLAASAAFYYTTFITLPYHLIILTIVSLIAATGFCLVEWKAASLEKMKALKNGVVATAMVELDILLKQQTQSGTPVVLQKITNKKVMLDKRHITFKERS